MAIIELKLNQKTIPNKHIVRVIKMIMALLSVETINPKSRTDENDKSCHNSLYI